MMYFLLLFGFCFSVYKCYDLEIYSFMQFPSTSYSTLLPLPTLRLAEIFRTDVFYCLPTSFEVRVGRLHSISAVIFGFQVVILVCVTLMYSIVRHTARCVTQMWAHVEPVHTGVPFDSFLNLSAIMMVGTVLRNLYKVHGRPPDVFPLNRRMTSLTGLSLVPSLRFEFGGALWLASQLISFIIHFGDFGRIHYVERSKYKKRKKKRKFRRRRLPYHCVLLCYSRIRNRPPSKRVVI